MSVPSDNKDAAMKAPSHYKLAESLPGEDPLERALSYPYARPDASYLYDDGAVRDIPVDFDFGSGKYVPFLVVGSNAAPVTLRRKYGTLSGVQIPVLRVACHDMDIIYCPGVTPHGYIPSSIAACDGVVLHTHAILLPASLVEQMNATEPNYHVCTLAPGCKQRIEFLDGFDQRVPFSSQHVYMYVVTRGPLLHTPSNAPIAVSFFHAENRSFVSMGEEKVLQYVQKFLGDTAPLNQWLLDLINSGDMQRFKEIKRRLNEISRVNHVDDCFVIKQTLGTIM